MTYPPSWSVDTELQLSTCEKVAVKRPIPTKRMVSFPCLDVANIGPSAILTLDRPMRGNALSSQLCESLVSALEMVINDAQIRCIILTGRGKYFCSGMDLASSDASINAEEAFENATKMFEAVRMCPKPTIARLNGPALGGGVGLALCCDIRIASADFYAQLSEVKRGLVPAIISRYLVEEVGASVARTWMLTADKIPCKDLHRLGVVHYISESVDHLDAVVQEVSSLILSGAPTAHMNAKRLVMSVIRQNKAESDKEIKAIFTGMVASEEAGYGIECFIKKEKPNWSSFAIGNPQELGREHKL